MIPKSGNRFSDKIMLKTKNPAREQQPGVAYGKPSSNFRSRRRSRVAAAGVGWAKAVYHLLHRRREFWPSVIARSTITRR
jgi:hypothetical protein